MPSSPDLPPEILDLIVDHLHAEPATLKACCLTSKLLVPRTRSHLFARVEFNSVSIKQWMKLFPDPSTSPVHYTRTLFLWKFPITGVDTTSALACIRSFCYVAELEIDASSWTEDDRFLSSLVPLHGLSPSLRSLSLKYTFLPLSEVLHLICSFPLLEDLTLNHYGIDGDTGGWDVPSTSPILNGILVLNDEHLSITRALLCLPNGLHFSKITLLRPVQDAELTMKLVSKCSETLESLSMRYFYWGVNRDTVPPAFDLSKTPKLKDIELHSGSISIKWIIETLQDAKPGILQRIAIQVHNLPSDEVGEPAQEWRDLDRLLSALWTSHSILPKVTIYGFFGSLVQRVFPGLMSIGAVRNVMGHTQSSEW